MSIAEEAGVGARAARRVRDAADGQGDLVRPANAFGRAAGAPERANPIGTAAGNCVNAPPGCAGEMDVVAERILPLSLARVPSPEPDEIRFVARAGADRAVQDEIAFGTP